MPVDIDSALDLRINHDLSYAKIAAIQKVCPNAIFKRLKPLLPDEGAEIYRENRGDIFSHLQLRLLSQVDSARLKKISVRDAVVSAAILYDKERLERGLSTEILDTRSLNVNVSKIDVEIRRLEGELMRMTGSGQSGGDEHE